jgi:hypothetical protein
MNTKQNIQSGKQFNKKPNHQNSPAKPDKNPDITKLRPEVNEPIKNNPAKIGQPLKTEVIDTEKSTSCGDCLYNKTNMLYLISNSYGKIF